MEQYEKEYADYFMLPRTLSNGLRVYPFKLKEYEKYKGLVEKYILLDITRLNNFKKQEFTKLKQERKIKRNAKFEYLPYGTLFEYLTAVLEQYKNTDLTTDYRTKSMYTIPLKMASGALLGVLQIINAKDDNGNYIEFGEEAELLIGHFATSAVQALQHAYLTSNMVKRMLKMAEFRDPKETYPHVERVSSYALEIYDRWAFNHNVPFAEMHRYRDALKIAAKFHDVGKVGISDVILKKTFPRFTEEERNIMKGHTCIGGQLFDPPESFLDEMSIEIALHHHDRWDGGETGYPGKIELSQFSIKTGIVPKCETLKGKEIPLSARIVAVADVFDALSHKRCYKEAWTIEDAFSEIQNNAGTQFDPEVVLAFMQIKDRICSISMAIPDDPEE